MAAIEAGKMLIYNQKLSTAPGVPGDYRNHSALTHPLLMAVDSIARRIALRHKTYHGEALEAGLENRFTGPIMLQCGISANLRVAR